MSIAEWHAALNDFPPALLLASVVFDLVGAAKSRDTLKAAGYWCLVAGAGMATVAVVSGLLAEDAVEKTAAVDRMIDTHEMLAISVTVLFVGLAAWRIWRRNRFSVQEQQSYTMASVVGMLVLLWAAHLGGTMVYRHAAGIPTDILRAETKDRSDSAPRAVER